MVKLTNFTILVCAGGRTVFRRVCFRKGGNVAVGKNNDLSRGKTQKQSKGSYNFYRPILHNARQI